MYQNKNILAIIPARGGSKAIPLKNLKKINGISLVGKVGIIANKIKEIDRIIISTDNLKIVTEAKNFGIQAPFLRPKYLSGDKISDHQVLEHALKKIEKIDKKKYDIIVMLQPTSPFRSVKEIKKSIFMLIDENKDAVWTISKTDSKSHPLKQLVFKNNSLDFYDEKGSEIIARQQLSDLYHRNGVAYSLTRECLLTQKSIKGKNTGALITKGFSISIDTEFDLELARYFAKKQKAKDVKKF